LLPPPPVPPAPPPPCLTSVVFPRSCCRWRSA
jgi:hypothetical protein